MADKVDAVAKAMADNATASDASSDAKLVKDEETGEMVSKTERKRRQKMRSTAAKKAQKKAAAPPEQKKDNDPLGDLDPNQVCGRYSLLQAGESDLNSTTKCAADRCKDGLPMANSIRIRTNSRPTSTHLRSTKSTTTSRRAKR
jgi:hypothetical protein